MTTHLVFDTLAYVDRLRNACIDEVLVRAHGGGLEQALREEVATKNDLRDVETALRVYPDTPCRIAQLSQNQPDRSRRGED